MVTKQEKLNFDNLKTWTVTKEKKHLKQVDKARKKSNFDKTQQLKLWKISTHKTPKIENGDKTQNIKLWQTQQLKLWPNSETKILTKFSFWQK